MNFRLNPESLLKKALTLDDTFTFGCNQCGKCCKYREDIIISPYDLFRIAKFLSETPMEVIEHYCIYYIGNDSRLPVVLLKALGSERACPFLKRRRCTIHQAKPAACALYPLGRMVKSDGKQSSATMYFLQPVRCGTKDQTHTVREWLQEFDLDQSDTWFQAWQETVFDLMQLVKELIQLLSEDTMNHFYSLLFSEMYLSYNLSEDFFPQFQNNMTRLKDFLSEMLRDTQGANRDEQ